MFPRPSSQIADYHEAQRFQDTYDHYLKPGLVTVAGLTGQNHVAALVVKTVTEAGQEQRKRGVTDGESVFAWSRLRLPPSGESPRSPFFPRTIAPADAVSQERSASPCFVTFW